MTVFVTVRARRAVKTAHVIAPNKLERLVTSTAKDRDSGDGAGVGQGISTLSYRSQTYDIHIRDVCIGLLRRESNQNTTPNKKSAE
jgi:hypothetical protein